MDLDCTHILSKKKCVVTLKPTSKQTSSLKLLIGVGSTNFITG